ncbi:MAG: glycosyltransferase family 2 protein [Muribaculaceae bacterium]|nr:glycosyltransferase family 2 protein [Muribaculaceae bacterium]
MKQDILYIVVPCYNEQEVLPITTPKLIEQLNALVEAQLIDKESRILYVNDGSIDDTWQLIEQYTQQHPQVCGVKLAGNVGHQNALLAGLEAASERADITISIDADLQDDVAVMRDMVQKYHEGCDIVYGVRRERKTDTWFKRNSALAFYKLMRRLGVKSIYNHADYRLMSRRAVKQLLNYRERNLFLRGIVPLVGYKTDSVFYDRSERLAGESKYPLSKMINFAVNGITSFSIKPVRMVLTLGIIFTLIALGILVYVLIAYFSGRTVSGWASLILSLWFIGGCVLIGLGIVGEYIGKIYIEVKDRPRYNIEKEIIQ